VATRDLGDAVEVRVRDNGTGIAPEIRDKLFQLNGRAGYFCVAA
jgi:signal transduction histidine kinase